MGIGVPAIGDDGVLVRVHAASVNAADWHLFHGGWFVSLVTWLMRGRRNRVGGSDLSGVVEAVGRSVTRFQRGDAVFGAGAGSFAASCVAREQHLALKPARLSFEEAAALPVAGVTALQGLRDHGGLSAGQRVLVYGAGGGVGTLSVQLAVALGATVTAATSTGNLDVVRTLGADEVMEFSEWDKLAAQRYDLILDVAATRPLRDLVRLMEPGGRLVEAGAAKSGGAFGIIGRLAELQFRSRLLRQRVGNFLARIRQEDLEALAALAAEGSLRPVIDRRFALADAVDAVRYVGTGKARAKVVISIGG